MIAEILFDSMMRIVREGDDHTSRQIALLLCLREGPATVRDLAERMNVAKPVVTRAIDRLEDDRYAERIDDPADRRSVLARLTPAGKDFVSKLVR